MRVLLADGHGATRRAVEAVAAMQSSWTLCGVATSAAEALARTLFLAPDVALVDVSLPGLPSTDLTQELRRLAPAMAIIILSPYTSLAVGDTFRHRGASLYLVKADIGALLARAIETVRPERPLVHGGSMASYERSPIALDEPAHVTAREREVLALLAVGRRNSEVAHTLGISRKTVETHRARIMNKLDLHSMSALVRYAIRHRLIEV